MSGDSGGEALSGRAGSGGSPGQARPLLGSPEGRGLGTAGLSHSSEMGQGAGMANDLTLSCEPGTEPRAQAGLVGPPWQDGHTPSSATHSQGVSVRPEGLPTGSLRPGVGDFNGYVTLHKPFLHCSQPQAPHLQEP